MDYKYLVYIAIPILGAFIGWLVNFLAIKMLFRPLRPTYILGINFQGLIPKRKKFLAEQIGQLAADELMSGTHVRDGLIQGGSVENIVAFIEDKIDDYLLNTFPDKYPITSVFFGVRRKAQIKADLIEEVHTAVPELLADYADNIDKQIDIKEIVRQKVEAIDPLELEKTMHQALDKDLHIVGYLCAGIGFAIGLVQVLLMVLIS